MKVCELQSQLDLSDLDLKCIIDTCLACPQPQKTLAIVLQLLIDKVCAIQDIIDTLNTASTTSDPEVRMAACFQYTDPSTGDLIKDLPHTQYTKRIGLEVCNLANQITGILLDITNLQDQIDALDVRVTILEGQTLPQVTLTCINPGLQPMDQAIEAIEADYCSLKGVLGSNTDVASIAGAEPTTLPVMSLANPAVALWSTASANAAESLEKMWLAINDLRGAVKAIQDNCCKVTCDDIIVDFDVKVVDQENILLFFAPKSTIPSGFTDCVPAGSTYKFVDALGHQWTYPVPLGVIFDPADPTYLTNGYPIEVGLGPIDVTVGFTISSDVCLTNGDTTCVKCVSVIVPPSNPDCCVITATDTVTIAYKICGITG